MIQEIKGGQNQTLFLDTRTDLYYSRFKAGLSWPSGSPGTLFVIGESVNRPFKGHMRKLEILEERTEKSLNDMAKTAAALQEIYLLEEWSASCEKEDGPTAEMFVQFAEDLRAKLSLNEPAIYPDLNLAIEMLRRRFAQNTLMVSEQGLVIGRIEQLNQITLDAAEKEDFADILILAGLIYDFDISQQDWQRPAFTPREPPSAMAV